MTLTRTITGDTPLSVTVSNVTRTDTGTVVTPGPVAMVAEGGGKYAYFFRDPAPGLTYAYTWTVKWSDGSVDSGEATQASSGVLGTIDVQVSGDTPASVTINSIVRLDNGTVLLNGPLSMTYQGGGVWIYPFTPSPPGIGFRYLWTATWADGSTTSAFIDVPGTAGVTGTYTTQALIEAMAPGFADIISNTTNDTTGPNAQRYASAIQSTDRLINQKFRVAKYVVPIPTTSAYFEWISELATKYALTELYFVPRGIEDDTQSVGGQLSNLRKEVLAALDAMIEDGLDDVRRADGTTGIRVPFNVFTRRGSLSNGMVPGGWPLVNN